MSSYPINEIFASIQGEGSRTGERCVFIRFQGCNLDCPYCDTKDAIKPDESKGMEDIEISAIVKEYKEINTVVFTGGEPLLWLDKNLIKRFKPQYYKDENKTYNIIIQTNGTKEISDSISELLDNTDIICCDIKCTASNFMEKYFIAKNNVSKGYCKVEFKVPVDNVDIALAIDRQVGLLKGNVYGLEDIYLSPVISENEDIKGKYKNFAGLNLNHTKLNFQIHKLIGVK